MHTMKQCSARLQRLRGETSAGNTPDFPNQREGAFFDFVVHDEADSTSLDIVDHERRVQISAASAAERRANR